MSEDVYTEIQVTVFVTEPTALHEEFKQSRHGESRKVSTHCDKTNQGILKSSCRRIEEQANKLIDSDKQPTSVKTKNRVRFDGLPNCNKSSRNTDSDEVDFIPKSSPIRHSKYVTKGNIADGGNYSKVDISLLGGNRANSSMNRNSNKVKNNTQIACTSPVKISFAEYCGRKQKQDVETIHIKETEQMANKTNIQNVNTTAKQPETSYENPKVYDENTTARKQEISHKYSKINKANTIAKQHENPKVNNETNKTSALQDKSNKHFNKAKTRLNTDIISELRVLKKPNEHSHKGETRLNTYLVSEIQDDLKEYGESPSNIPKMKILKVENTLDEKETHSKIILTEGERALNENKLALKQKDTSIHTMTEDTSMRPLAEDTSMHTMTDDTSMRTMTEETSMRTLTEDTSVRTMTANTSTRAITEDTSMRTLTEDKSMHTMTEDISMHTITKRNVDSKKASYIDGNVSKHPVLCYDSLVQERDIKDSTNLQKQITDVAESIRNVAETLFLPQRMSINTVTGIKVNEKAKQNYKTNAKHKNSLLNKSEKIRCGIIYDQTEYKETVSHYCNKCPTVNTSVKLGSSCRNACFKDDCSSSNDSEERGSASVEDGISCSTFSVDDVGSNTLARSGAKSKQSTEYSRKRKRSHQEQYYNELVEHHTGKLNDCKMLDVKDVIRKTSPSTNHRHKLHNTTRERQSPMKQPIYENSNKRNNLAFATEKRNMYSQSRHKRRTSKYGNRLNDDDNSRFRNNTNEYSHSYEEDIKHRFHEEDDCRFYDENIRCRFHEENDKRTFYEENIQCCFKEESSSSRFNEEKNLCRFPSENDNSRSYEANSCRFHYKYENSRCCNDNKSRFDENTFSDKSRFDAYRGFCYMKSFRIIRMAAFNHFVRSEQRHDLSDYDIEDFEYKLIQGLKRTLDRYIFSKDPLSPRFLSKKIMSTAVLQTIRNPNERNGRQKCFHQFNYAIGYVDYDLLCYWCEVQFRNGHFVEARPIISPYPYSVYD